MSFTHFLLVVAVILGQAAATNFIAKREALKMPQYEHLDSADILDDVESKGNITNSTLTLNLVGDTDSQLVAYGVYEVTTFVPVLLKREDAAKQFTIYKVSNKRAADVEACKTLLRAFEPGTLSKIASITYGLAASYFQGLYDMF